MAKKYIFVRMPEDVYNIYKGIKINMEMDIKKLIGKDVKLTMPKVFRAVASPDFNENFILIDKTNLIKLVRGKRK